MLVRLVLLKRALVGLVLVSFLIGTTAQAFVDLVVETPCAMMMTSSEAASAGSSDDDGGVPPAMPVCFNTVGCIVTAGLPSSPSTGWTPLIWTDLQYQSAVPALQGLAFSPELDPPRPS